jgi:P-type E1-E2 ATPase
VAVSTALAATNGLLIRNRAAFERARKLQAIIFDKTGTLTEGRFGVTDTLVFTNETDERQLLNCAAAVDAHSEHPIAKAIVSAEAQITRTKGLSLRRLRRWSSRAISSFPVPVSPKTRTVASVGATISICLMICHHDLL